MKSLDVQTGGFPEVVDKTRQCRHPVGDEHGCFVRACVARSPIPKAGDSSDRAASMISLTCEFGGVLAPAGGKRHRGCLPFSRAARWLGQLNVKNPAPPPPGGVGQNGWRGRRCGRVPGPTVVEREQADTVFFPYGAADDFSAVLDFSQNGSVEVEVEMEAAGARGTIGGRGDGRVYKPSDGHPAGPGDAQARAPVVPPNRARGPRQTTSSAEPPLDSRFPADGRAQDPPFEGDGEMDGPVGPCSSSRQNRLWRRRGLSRATGTRIKPDQQGGAVHHRETGACLADTLPLWLVIRARRRPVQAPFVSRQSRPRVWRLKDGAAGLEMTDQMAVHIALGVEHQPLLTQLQLVQQKHQDDGNQAARRKSS